MKRTRIVEAFPTIGAKILFDYGDNWQFRIEAIGQNLKEPGAKYPKLPRNPSARRPSCIRPG